MNRISQAILPPTNGEKKKTVAGQVASCAHNGFSRTAAVLSNIKAAVPYALDKGVTTTR